MLLSSPKATVLQTVLRLYQYNTPKMVGAVGLAPTKAVRPRRLQRLAIAAMRYSHKNWLGSSTLTTKSIIARSLASRKPEIRY